MPAPKGTQPPGGSRRGKPNKNTAALKDMILTALSRMGGERYLMEQAAKNPGPFLALIGKVLPTTLAGDPGNPVEVKLSIEAQRAAAQAVLDEAFGKEGE